VVGIFPNNAAVLWLVSAVVAETHDEWQDSERRYLADGTMALLYEPAADMPLDTKEVMPARLAS
jgi:putative transposase